MQTERKDTPRMQADQSGIALPLAMVMVMLISVVGAGLLVFVVSDNSSAAQVNRGQQAFGMADAGIGAAQAHIRQSLEEGEDPTSGLWGTEEGMPIRLPSFDEPVNVTIEPEDDKYIVTSTGNALNSSARRKVQAVFQSNNAEGGYTAPANYYAGTNMTLNNYTEMVKGDILVEGRADITNTMKLTDGDVLIKGYGNLPNEKTITRGNIYIGGGAAFNNTTTVNDGSIYVDGNQSGNPNTFANNTTVTNGGIYVGDRATFSNNTKITGGDLYVEGDTRVGNLDVGSGGNVLIGGRLTVDNGIKLEGGNLYVRGNGTNTTVIQNASINNSRIYINGPVEFRQSNTITNSEIYAGGYTNFTNASTLTGTSLFVNGSVNFSNPMVFGSVDDARYGNWQNTINSTARANNLTAVGATGTISGNLTGVSKGTRSYDSTTTPRFVATVATPQPLDRIRFPFDPANPPDKIRFDSAAARLETAKADAIQRIEEGKISDAFYEKLRQRAITQGNYRNITSSGTHRIVNGYLWGGPQEWNWPAPSTYETVVYYRFPAGTSGSKVEWLINDGCTSKAKKGILVIENGDFDTYGTRSGFNGTIVIRNGKFQVQNDYCMNGYVNSQTSFTSSNSSKFNLDDVPPLKDFNDPASASVVSWREVYE